MDFNWKKLNFPEFRKSEHIKKYVADLKLRTDEEDNVYYLDIIYKVLYASIILNIEPIVLFIILVFMKIN